MREAREKGRILVVDDERSMREMLEIFLGREGFGVASCASGSEALRLLEEGSPGKPGVHPFDLLITDINMPGLSGFDLLREARARDPELPVLMITAYGSPDSAVEAMKRGATDYLTKPFRIEEVKARIAGPLERRRLARENLALQRALSPEGGLPGMVGKSAGMRAVFDLVNRLSEMDSTVILTGESGTGKELVARALHARSRRAGGPFVTVNCGALVETLLESELFGHRKGSFTGAVADRKGLFEAATGGTLFLDEVTETSPALQVKLLRAVQEREVVPVGDTRAVKVDARIIAATNRDLGAAVREGRFREDLFYRLNVINIPLPPLRERREDIPPLVDHFLLLLGGRHGRRVTSVSAQAMEKLLGYSFPGNVRELENVLERGMALTQGEVLEEPSLPPEVREAVPAPPPPPPPGQPGNLDALLSAYERSLIEQALARSGGNRTRAAEILGVTFHALRHRLKRLGIEDDKRGGK